MDEVLEDKLQACESQSLSEPLDSPVNLHITFMESMFDSQGTGLVVRRKY